MSSWFWNYPLGHCYVTRVTGFLLYQVVQIAGEQILIQATNSFSKEIWWACYSCINPILSTAMTQQNMCLLPHRRRTWLVSKGLHLDSLMIGRHTPRLSPWILFFLLRKCLLNLVVSEHLKSLDSELFIFANLSLPWAFLEEAPPGGRTSSSKSKIYSFLASLHGSLERAQAN